MKDQQRRAGRIEQKAVGGAVVQFGLFHRWLACGEAGMGKGASVGPRGRPAIYPVAKGLFAAPGPPASMLMPGCPPRQERRGRAGAQTRARRQAAQGGRVQPVISVRNLKKTYASGFQALKGVNLDIRKGEIFALLGPNGAGE